MRTKVQSFDPRQTMMREDFEVFHYFEPKAMDVEVHHHDFFEVYLFLKGNVTYWVEGQFYKLEPGDMLLINPLQLHRPIIDEESGAYERIVLWINKDYLNNISTEGINLSKCFEYKNPSYVNIIRPTNTKYSSIVEKLMDLVEEMQKKEIGFQIISEGIFMQFMTLLNRIIINKESMQLKTKKNAGLISKVLAFINDNINKELSLEKISDSFFVSKYHLSHEFSRETGVSLYRYIILKRLLLAKQMLQDGEGAVEVCFKCGFKDYAGFYRAFKSEYGISPSAFIKSR